MRQRLLGRKTGLRVSEMALGCGLLGATPGGPDPRRARDTLLAFAQAGGTLLDTSSAHQGGKSEEIIGQFLADEGREHFVVATKFGRAPGGDVNSLASGSHPRAMIAQVEASLRRLNTDRIDLYTMEFPDGITPVEEIMRGLNMLVQQGKIVTIALSNFSAWQTAQAATLADMRGWAPLSALHYQYNLLERSVESEHLPMADALGLGVLAWSPQARGRLTRGELDGVPSAVAATLRLVAEEQGVGVGTVALAWLLAKGVIPVVGARSPEQLAPSLEATKIMLTNDQRAQLSGSNSAKNYAETFLAPLRTAIGIDDVMLASAQTTKSC